MNTYDILKLIYEIHKKNNISLPYICGGVPRDKLLGKIDTFNDLDITTGDESIHELANMFSQTLSKKYNIFTKRMNDGHVSVYINNLKVDFSSNFISPHINSINLKKNTNLFREVYSRDFTCNSLLLSLDLNKIYDLTEHGIEDTSNKLIKTCLTPEITFKDSPNRIVRAIYLSSKLNFELDDSIKLWVKNNKDYIFKIESEYITKKINKALSYSIENTDKLITEMDMWNSIPISNQLYPLYKKRVLK